MANRKGAFQISLGFIIAVVFAVVLLSLALSWLSGLMTQIGEVTHQVTDVAREELMNEISQTGQNVGLAAPAITKWRRGETGSFAVGVRNKYTDKPMTFYMNVYLEKIGGGLTVMPDVSSWLTFSDREFVEESGSTSTDVILKPPAAGVDSGIYMFRVLVCEDQPCDKLDTTPEENIYGSESFSIEIERV